ncbi:MAG: peroxidase family protein [Sneathiella sp.]
MEHGNQKEPDNHQGSNTGNDGFGRLCPHLPAWSPPDIDEAKLEGHFLAFANTQMSEKPGKGPTEIAADPDLREELDNKFNASIPAGYTYFGQFIDHDLTLDTTPLSETNVDPEQITNFRTPKLDLDSVYGGGPLVQSDLYEKSEKGKITGRLLTGAIRNTAFKDLQRSRDGRALIGDKRNDENAIVSQLHLAFILAHNELVDRIIDRDSTKKDKGEEVFSEARRTLVFLYQWIVWKDFLKRLTASEIWETALQKVHTAGRIRWKLGFMDIYSGDHPLFMPLEFSGAAYRFGHSMVRNSYQTNILEKEGAGFGVFIPIFDISADAQDDLSGFRPLSAKRVIQWDWFLTMESSQGSFPQQARKIDTRLCNALSALREDKNNPEALANILAARNLIRGVRLGLPSGPDIARTFGFKPLNLSENEPEALWYYILKEAETLAAEQSGQHLGGVGSMILCATFAGILRGDPHSWINIHPAWTPDDDPLLESSDKRDTGDWNLSSIIRLSKLPVSGDDIQQIWNESQQEQQEEEPRP